MPYERRPNFELFEIEKLKRVKAPWYVRKMTDEQRKAQRQAIAKSMGQANKGHDRVLPIHRKVLINWSKRACIKNQALEREKIIQHLRAKYPDLCS